MREKFDRVKRQRKREKKCAKERVEKWNEMEQVVIWSSAQENAKENPSIKNEFE